MNVVSLVGRLGKDPEAKATKSGENMAIFSLAISRPWDDETDWVDCVAFKQTADFVLAYLDKGALVDVEGRLQQDRWTDDHGHERSKLKIIANRVQALETKAEAERRRGGPKAAPAEASPFGDDDDSDPFGDQ